MDIITILIGVAVFFISALMIYCISAFSMKEKTFEEVMEEQRRRQEEEREKAKAEKKAEKEQHKKKYGKKGKQEKVKDKAPPVFEPLEHKMVNLEIEPEIIEPTESLGLGSAVRHRGKKEKSTKSILHNRDEVAPVAEKTVEVRHKAVPPKDELELKKAHEKVIVEKIEKVKTAVTESPVKEKTKVSQEGKEKTKHSLEIKENLPPRKSDDVVKEKAPKSSSDGEKRSSKQKSNDDAPLNGSRLISSVKTAKLSDTEVQTLIEVLLNKQGVTSGIPDAPAESWNKKSQKGDPVLLLKKQLEEKERALQEGQSMVMSANARLKELRQELGAERSKSSAMEKQFEEKLANQQAEMEALHRRMHQSHEQHRIEASTLQARVRLLEQGGDRGSLQKLTDENKTLQEALNLKAQETVKLNETAKNLEKQLAASVSKIQSAEAGKKSVEAKVVSYEEKIRNLEAAQKDVEALVSKRVEEVAAELRKSESKNASLSSDLQNANTALSAAQGEVSKLKGELQEQVKHLKKADASQEEYLEKLNKQVRDVSQRLAEREAEIQKLMQENKVLADENKMINEKLQNSPAPNGDIHTENGPSVSVEEHERILSEKSAEVTELTKSLENQKKAASSLQVELDTKAAELEDVKQQLSQQKTKNNELREKNWKAMEALNETEKASAQKVEKALKSARELSSGGAELEKYDKAVFLRLFPDVQVSDKLSHKEWVTTFEKQALKKISANSSEAQKVFQLQEENKKLQSELDLSKNSIQDLNSKASRLAEVEKEYEQLKSSQSSQVDSEEYKQIESDNSRLKAEVDEYRNIVSETESKLKQLEKSIDAREKEWQEKLKRAESLASGNGISSERIAQLESLVTDQENQMQEYRRVLAQTELSLKEVENKVASQEKSWQEKLDSSQSELSKSRSELTNLQQELLNSRGSQEMTAKVESLESELKESQERILVLTKEKETMTTKVIELESRVSSVDSVDSARVEKDVSELQSQLEAERKKNKELSLNVVKLNGIIKTGQDALSQEQGLVKKLQEQLDSKSVNSGVSEMEEIDQLRIKLSEKQKLLEREMSANKHLSERLAQLGVLNLWNQSKFQASSNTDNGTSV